MRIIFLDTVGLLALWDESDQWHESAQRAYEQFSAEPVRLVTTSFVLLECGNAAARRPYRQDVADLWHALEQTGDLIHPTRSNWPRPGRSTSPVRPEPRGSSIWCRSR